MSGDGSTDIQFTLGVDMAGDVIVNFGDNKIDHLKLTQEQALFMAEGLVEAVQEADRGRADVLRVNG